MDINREKKLLKFIFDNIDKVHPSEQDDYLIQLANIYNTDTTNIVCCFINYTWATLDDKNPDEIIDNFIFTINDAD